MLIEQLIHLEKLEVRTENLNFRTGLQDQLMDGWSVTQQMIVYKGRLLKKSSNQKSTMLHGFQTLHIVCYRFGCKLWLQLIQMHA